MKKNRTGTSGIDAAGAVSFFVASALIACIVFLAFITTRSSDDYLYMSFTNGSFGEFAEHMRWHYLNYNGRTLVHALDSLILRYGNISFAFVCFACHLLLLYSIKKLFGLPYKAFAVLFCAGFLLIPTTVMVEGYLWISAFCNYMLPAVLIVLEVVIFKSNINCRKHGFIKSLGMILYCFICGALHEQAGIVSFAVCLMFVFAYFTEDNNIKATPLLCLAASIGGLISVVLSPATESRMGRSMTESFVDMIISGLHDQTKLIRSNWYFSVLLILCFVFMLIGNFRKPFTKTVCLVNTILFTALSAGMYLASEDLAVWCWFMILIDMVVTGMIFAVFERSEYILLIAAAVSNAVMTVTGVSVNRTVLPSFVYILVIFSGVAGIGLGELFSGKDRNEPKTSDGVNTAVLTPVSLALAVLALVLTVPRFPAYYANYRIFERNRESVNSVKDTEVIYLCMDYDFRYTHKGKAYEDGFFYNAFLDYIKQKENHYKVYLYGENAYPLYVNGQRTEIPAIKGDEGRIYLPLYEVVRGAGAELYEDENTAKTIISYDGNEFYCEIDYTMGYFSRVDVPGRQPYTTYGLPNYYSFVMDSRAFNELWLIEAKEGWAENGEKAIMIDTYEDETR
ncbi:MAG: hypothetical protein IJT91_01210 [Clostridia bacterium]|nr:hypothetical protein [Clostridia bacterium]